ARLEAVEYVADEATPEALDKTYGLAKPALSATVTFTDAKKPAQTLLVGKQRPGKQEYFAKLASAPGVFAVRKDTHDDLDGDSRAYRPLELWRVPQDEIAELRVRKGGPEYRLRREGGAWKITGPFEAPASPEAVKPLAEQASELRAERFVAHAPSDLS